MKKLQKLGLLVVSLLVLVGAGAKAAVIAWGPATSIGSSGGDGQGDVITNGTLVVAYNVGNPNVGTATINGVPFTYSNAAGAGLSGSLAFVSGAYGGGSAPFDNLSVGYRRMVDDWAYTGGSSFTLTLSGLTVGREYALQWWTDDSRSDGAGRTTTATDGNSNSITLSQNVSGVAGGLGQFAVGTFVATSGSEVITFSTVGAAANISGYQLRDISIPEPSVAGLLVLGGLLLWRRRK